MGTAAAHARVKKLEISSTLLTTLISLAWLLRLVAQSSSCLDRSSSGGSLGCTGPLGVHVSFGQVVQAL